MTESSPLANISKSSRLYKLFANVIAVLIGIGVGFGILVGTELALRSAEKKRAPLEATASRTPHKTWTERVPGLGARLQAAITAHDRVSFGNQEVYNAAYSTDQYHRRITPAAHENQRSYVALFFGCSFTFGLGVEQNETLPAQFGEFAPQFVPVNYGCSGWGPQHMWMLFQEDQLAKQFPRQDGLMIYVYIADHLNRIIGKSSDNAIWRDELPCLSLKHEHLVSDGLFCDEKPVSNYLKRKLWRFRVVRLVKNGFCPTVITPADVAHGNALIIQAIKESTDRMHAMAPGIHCCVLIYPGSPEGKDLISPLTEAGIVCFDYSTLFIHDPRLSDKLWLHDGYNGVQGHPSPYLHRLVAKQLAHDVQTKFPQFNPLASVKTVN